MNYVDDRCAVDINSISIEIEICVIISVNSNWDTIRYVHIELRSTDDRVLLTEEDERRWNTPPELIPEQVNKESDAKARSLSISNVENNAHSFGFQASPEGVSYSQSNSFGRPLSQTSGYVFVLSRVERNKIFSIDKKHWVRLIN